MNKAARIVLLVWIGIAVVSWAQLGKAVALDIRLVENVEAKQAELHVWLGEPAEIIEVKATSDDRELPVKYQPFGAEGMEDTCALLFLIDKSDPRRARTIEAARALTLQVIERSAPHTDSAVYAFDANLELVVDFGTPWDEVAEDLKKVKAVGLATELYRNAIEAIGILEKRSVQRRALMIFSDGRAEDTTYTLEQVVEAAKKAGVIIYGVGYAENAQSTIYLQSLRRLASETGGPFVEAAARTRAVPEEFVNAVHPILRSGGLATVDLADNQTAKEIQVTVQVEGREPVRQTIPLVKLVPPPPPPMSPAKDPKVDEVASRVAAVAQKVEEVAKQVQQVPGKVEEAARKAEAAAREAAEKKEAAEIAQAAELARKNFELADQQARKEAGKKFRGMLYTGLLSPRSSARDYSSSPGARSRKRWRKTPRFSRACRSSTATPPST